MIESPSLPRALIDFVRLGRPRFLVGGFVMHGLGLALARYVGAPIDVVAAVWCQMAITTIQLMTHYCNEYFDLAADRANPTPTRWAGGSRVLVEGRIAPKVALGAALILAALALKVILVLTLVVRPNPVSLGMFVTALVLAWSYSAPPLRLHSRGVGEITTALLVPGLATFAGFFVQTGRFDALPILVALPLSVLQFGMLLPIEVPDLVGDAAVGKRTLVVRLGAERAARLYLVTLAAPYLLLSLILPLGLPPLVALADFMGLPIAAFLAWQVWNGAWADPARWDTLEFWAIALFVGTAIANLGAILLS